MHSLTPTVHCKLALTVNIHSALRFALTVNVHGHYNRHRQLTALSTHLLTYVALKTVLKITTCRKLMLLSLLCFSSSWSGNLKSEFGAYQLNKVEWIFNRCGNSKFKHCFPILMSLSTHRTGLFRLHTDFILSPRANKSIDSHILTLFFSVILVRKEDSNQH